MAGRAISIEDAWRLSGAHGNNFDALRLLAATMVIVSHSFEIVGGPAADEPLRRLTSGDASLGRVAVMTFFMLSGFLLARSLAADPSLVSFARKRALRILPALILVVVLSAFVLGPLFSALSPPAYFASADSWRYLANAAFYTGFDSLPGVFEGSPVGHAFNGPLWTLKFEVLCYLTLAAAGAFKRFGPRSAAALFVAFYAVEAMTGEGPHRGASYYVHQYADLARPFFAGALFARLADRIVLTPMAAALAATGLAIAAPSGFFTDAFPLFGGFLVFWLGFAPLAGTASAARYGDFSYGLYLWGWPAQQMVQGAFAPADWFANVLLALPLALAASVASWLLVERPALALKPARRRRTAAAAH